MGIAQPSGAMSARAVSCFRARFEVRQAVQSLVTVLTGNGQAAADELAADVIVVGSHGRGKLFDLVVGSVSAGVIRKSQVPVLVVPAR